MSENSTLTGINRAFKQRGGPAMRNARKSILQNFKDESNCSQALRYFSKVTLRNALPVFPALISMACEAVGGDTEKTTPFGEAIVLITAAADLHDDVIDQSFEKGPKQTVLGKFGTDVAILAGDILLVEGLRKFYEAAESIPEQQAREIARLISEAVFEICSAEALERQFHKKSSITPDEYQEVIRRKAVVPEISMKIGAILGNGNAKDVKSLGQFGRMYGINSGIIEEFIDLLDIQELKNRLKNECLPLPILYAIENPQIKANLFPLLSPILDECGHKKIVEIVLESSQMKMIYNILTLNAKNEQTRLVETIKGKIGEELQSLLLTPLKSIEV